MEDSNKGLRCLVTGGAGFLGSHLCDQLLARGATVTALDDLSGGRIGNLGKALSRKGFTFVEGSAMDEALVDDLTARADLILHLAAVVGVRRVWEAPEETLHTNVRSTQLVFDAAARHGVRVLFTSSSEVYGKATAGPLSEEAPLFVGATDSRRWSYAFSKACGEWLAQAHHRSHGLEAVSVRLFNVVGPRQSAAGGMVLPRFVRQALDGEPLTVFGDGTQTRSFLHVGDAARAILGLALPGGPNEGVFNVGGTSEVDVMSLARCVARTVGGEVPIVRMPYREAFGVGFDEPRRRRPDISKLVERTGFQATVSLEDTVAELVREARRDARNSPPASLHP